MLRQKKLLNLQLICFQKLSLEAAEKGWTIVSWITEEDNYRGRAVYDRTAKKTNWVTYELRI